MNFSKCSDNVPMIGHPNNCKLYYDCEEGIETICEKDWVFNPKTAACDKPRNVPECYNKA